VDGTPPQATMSADAQSEINGSTRRQGRPWPPRAHRHATTTTSRRQTVTRTARAARAGLLSGAAVILGWTSVGAYQFAATYGAWYEHTIFVGVIGALLTLTAVATAHRVAPWDRPTRFASIVVCLIAVAAVTAAGTVVGTVAGV
jgi:hypothetical protein